MNIYKIFIVNRNISFIASEIDRIFKLEPIWSYISL